MGKCVFCSPLNEILLTRLIRSFDIEITGKLYAIFRQCRDIEKIREGIAEKASHCLYAILGFLNFQIMSFSYGWKLSLVILSYMPLIMVISGIMEMASDFKANDFNDFIVIIVKRYNFVISVPQKINN